MSQRDKQQTGTQHAAGHVEEWDGAVDELRELLKKLEDPNFSDPEERMEAEEAIAHGFDEVELMFRDAWDTKKNEVLDDV